MKPRPYQMEAVQAAYARFKAAMTALLVMATGTGKTFTAAIIIHAAMCRGVRVLWFAHRDELIRQPCRTLTGEKAPAEWRAAAKGRVGFVKAGEDAAAAQVVYASVDTLRGRATGAQCGSCGALVRQPRSKCKCGADDWSVVQYMPRLERILSHGPIGLVVVDEAHHVASEGQQRVVRRTLQHALEAAKPGITEGLDLDETTPVELVALGAQIGNPVKLLGLTATPERTDKLRLSDTWGEEPAFFFPIERAIAEGFLLPPIFDRQLLKLDRKKFEAMTDEAAAKELLSAGAVQHCVKAMEAYRGKRTALVFVPSVDMAREVDQALKEAGWRSSWLCGDTDKADRARIIRRVGSGQLDCVVNVGVLTEGTDIPRCDLAVLLRPCKSKPLYIQIVGRVLRTFEEQSDAVVLDLTGASLEHDLTQAPVILDREVEERPPPEEDPDSDEFRPPGRRQALGMVGGLAGIQGREPIRPAWAMVRDVVGEWMACDCGGDLGLVIVGPFGDGYGAWYHKKRRKKPPIELHDGRAVSLVEAQNLAADVYRRADALFDRKAEWRNEPPDHEERSRVRFGKLRVRHRNDWGQWVLGEPGVVPPRATKGDVVDAITARWARKVIENHDLAVILTDDQRGAA